MTFCDKTRFWYQWATAVLLNLADFIMTSEYISRVGIEGEGNPLQHTVLEHFGSVGMFFFKATVLMIVVFLLYGRPQKTYKLANNLLCFVNIFTFAVILWTTFLLATT